MTRKQIRLLRALGVDFANPFADNIKYALDHGYLKVAETVSPKVRLQINKTVDKAYKELMNKPPEVAYKKLSEKIRKKPLSNSSVADAERAVALYKLNHNAMKHKYKRIADIGKNFSSSDYFEDTSWYNRQVKPTGPGTMTMLLEPKKPKYPCKVCGEKKMSYKGLICNRCYLKSRREKKK